MAYFISKLMNVEIIFKKNRLLFDNKFFNSKTRMKLFERFSVFEWDSIVLILGAHDTEFYLGSDMNNKDAKSKRLHESGRDAYSAGFLFAFKIIIWTDEIGEEEVDNNG